MNVSVEPDSVENDLDISPYWTSVRNIIALHLISLSFITFQGLKVCETGLIKTFWGRHWKSLKPEKEAKNFPFEEGTENILNQKNILKMPNLFLPV